MRPLKFLRSGLYAGNSAGNIGFVLGTVAHHHYFIQVQIVLASITIETEPLAGIVTSCSAMPI